jgi:hypothetical protein
VNTRAVLHLPYQAARTPLAILDTQLVKRLPDDSPPRLAFERLLGTIDEAAGRLLDDKGLERRGTQLRERADKLGHAAQLEQRAATRRRAATEMVQDAKQEAGALRNGARSHQRDGVQAALETERKEKQAATRRSRAQASTAKRQADARAARKIESVEQQRTATEARANARERRATVKASADLAQAAAGKAAARARRSEAAQLGKLAEDTQRARKNS